jgi:hypothetical protein
MMRLLFGVSLLTNFILSYFLLTKEPEKEVIERVIIETHEKKNPRPVQIIDTRKVVQPKINKQNPQPQPLDATSAEIQDAGEKMETDRVEFLTTELGMTEEKVNEHNRIRDDFYKKTSQFFQKDPMRELSFKERRELIKMEEKLHQDLEKLHGKKNWERYQKFRESYNRKGFKRQTDENLPVMFMGI